MLEMVEKAMLDNNFEKSHYAHLYDRVKANLRQPQRYGTLRYKNKKSGKWELYECEEPEKLAQYRAEMGLVPIKK